MSDPASPPEEIRAPCPKCGPNRVAHVMAVHEESGSDDQVQWWTDYRVIRCAGCRNVQLQIASRFSEDYDYDEGPDGQPYMTLNETHAYWPPLTKRPTPDWVTTIERTDPLLGSILVEIYQALDNDMPIAAAVTMRTAFDRATELLGINAALTFEQKMAALVTNGEIAAKDLTVLKPLVEAGNAAAHRGWTPIPGELTTMILILEGLLHRVFILNHQVTALANRTPPKPSKPAKQQ